MVSSGDMQLPSGKGFNSLMSDNNRRTIIVEAVRNGQRLAVRTDNVEEACPGKVDVLQIIASRDHGGFKTDEET
jgi:hypothetical protein